ncbi:hypothetical protein [Arthrobacter sp. HMWF013]|uniref:hypothetical protein n=1 Tax=Arthrobacter sp. HMWF013 TaxID=2056849 RepID=UPI000D3489C5|nr:hypothetical protein [Arthrobacter sp. HMWF013]PTT64567.1 hypothetical protein DBR22_13830 [Arthrobacter sp. HMWF013]
MSDVLNAEVTSNEEGGFSRRRVVKGVAWSVPVLVTAIAVPPASASGGKFEALLDFNTPDTVNFVQQTRPAVAGQNRPGKGPIGFHLLNKSGATSGPIVGTITITPSPATATSDPVVGINTFSGGTLTVMTPPPAVGTFSANFSLPGGVANNATATFLLDFYYTGTSKTVAIGKQFNLTVSFTSPTGLLALPAVLQLN